MKSDAEAWDDLLEAVLRIPDTTLAREDSEDTDVLQYEDEDECPGCCLCGICKCDGNECY